MIAALCFVIAFLQLAIYRLLVTNRRLKRRCDEFRSQLVAAEQILHNVRRQALQNAGRGN